MPRVAPPVLPPFAILIEAHGDELLAHARRLTDAEQKFHDEWPGSDLYIVNSVEEAIALLRTCG